MGNFEENCSKDKINNVVSQFQTFKSYFRNPCNSIKRSPCYIGKKVINMAALGHIYMLKMVNCYYDENGSYISKG